jgi:hypothetical protein
MASIGSGLRIAVVLLTAAAKAPAQSTVPVIAPTSLPAPASARLLSGTTVTPRALHPAQVGYVDGQLSILAENSNLNQILREVGRLTGMKITGNIAAQRVFGRYGPGPPAEILATLLDGTGSNMLLIAHQSGAPQELILTPREGSVTPPNLSAVGFEDDAPLPEQAQVLPQLPQNPASELSTSSSAMGGGAASTSSSTLAGSDAASATPSTSSDNLPTPNGVPTPQQIYQQLQMLQQAQQSQPPR